MKRKVKRIWFRTFEKQSELPEVTLVFEFVNNNYCKQDCNKDPTSSKTDIKHDSYALKVPDGDTKAKSDICFQEYK